MVELARPQLTMPAREADWIRAAYAKAAVILEYGSGGSTIVAAELPEKTVFSVESDRAWADDMLAYIDDINPPSKPVLHYADVGKTGEWGRPLNNAGWRKYHKYPLGVWDRSDFVQPDVVLIDGRFRAACLLTVLFRTLKQVTVYFDDYANRSRYHVVEEFVPVAETRGRMARFDVAPQDIHADRLSQIMSIFKMSL